MTQAITALAPPGQRSDDNDWTTRAQCRQVDPDLFFPDKGGSSVDAKRICAGCPVRAACLDYALKNEERFGVWGGTSEHERRQLLNHASGEGLPLAS